MNPKHENPKRPERTATAPYNFVPLPERPFTSPDGSGILNPDQSSYHKERLTGWIDVTLQTRAPIYIRGPLTPKENLKREEEDNNPNDRTPHLQKLRNKPDFYHNGNPANPVIPGSSLRGMIRSVVEILGHGKFAPVPERPLVYRAVGDISSHGEAYRQQLMDEEPSMKNYFTPKYLAGFIRKHGDSWYIQPAAEVNGITFARIMHKDIPRNDLKNLPGLRNAYEIYVAVGKYEFQPVRGGFVNIRRMMVTHASPIKRDNLVPAVLAESGPIPKKASEAVVFRPDLTAGRDDTWIRIPDGNESNDSRDIIGEYKEQLSPAQEKILGIGGALREWQPVFYLMENGRFVFFGHTQLFRLTYKRSPKGFLPISFTDEERIDLAEAIFGKVRGSRGGQAGRVFVGDACLDPNPGDPWLPGGEVIPKILSTPKPTTFQHYLTQSQPDVPRGKGLHTYNNNPTDTTLRGYKRYWLKGDTPRERFAERQESVRAPELEKQHTRIKPLRSGLTFHFRVRFENLLPQELGLLWWALALPAKDGGDYCHQIGMGKPLGLGAIKLTPELHLMDPSRRYDLLFTADGEKWESGEERPEQTAKLLEVIVRQFEEFIAKSQGQAGTPMVRLERVRMLLEMLRWREATSEWLEQTRYMEIEHHSPDGRKTNEYRERPVLPDPLHVK